MQTLGAQLLDEPAWQTPLPSQVRAPYSVVPSQRPGWHSTPAGYSRQPPLPSQAPSCWQPATGSSEQSLPGS